MKTVYIILAFCLGLFVGHLLFPNQNELKPPLAEVSNRNAEKVNAIDSVKLLADKELLAQNVILKIKLNAMEGLLSENKSKLLSERN